MPKERSVVLMIWNNFIASFRPRPIKGNLMGQDGRGNKYFEIPADPSVGKRKASRWFQPLKKDKFDEEIPAEWEAWLRGRREKPPTVEELTKNEAIRQLTQQNALEKGYLPKPVTEEKMHSFPRYEEYEITPGEKINKDDK